MVETKKPRGKKGDGPVTVSYIDDKNVESKRVPTNVSQVKVADKKGGVKAYPINVVGAATLQMLAAKALAKELDLFIRNTSDGSDVIALADKKIASLRDGKLYTKGEGKGTVGRQFDYDLYVDAAREMINAKVKAKTMAALSDEKLNAKLEALRTKLSAFSTPKERKAYIDDKLLADKVYKVQFLTLQAKKRIGAAKEAEADEANAMDAF